MPVSQTMNFSEELGGFTTPQSARVPKLVMFMRMYILFLVCYCTCAYKVCTSIFVGASRKLFVQTVLFSRTMSFESRLQYAVEDQRNCATLKIGPDSPKPRKVMISRKLKIFILICYLQRAFGSFDFLNKMKKAFRRPSDTSGSSPSPRKVKVCSFS